jgi:hypothetical protein
VYMSNSTHFVKASNESIIFFQSFEHKAITKKFYLFFNNIEMPIENTI